MAAGFCTVALNDLASYHPYGGWNFGVAARFLEELCTPALCILCAVVLIWSLQTQWKARRGVLTCGLCDSPRPTYLLHGAESLLRS
jgi:hypothetical protein